jgi:hypothetical protein
VTIYTVSDLNAELMSKLLLMFRAPKSWQVKQEANPRSLQQWFRQCENPKFVPWIVDNMAGAFGFPAYADFSKEAHYMRREMLHNVNQEIGYTMKHFKAYNRYALSNGGVDALATYYDEVASIESELKQVKARYERALVAEVQAMFMFKYSPAPSDLIEIGAVHYLPDMDNGELCRMMDYRDMEGFPTIAAMDTLRTYLQKFTDADVLEELIADVGGCYNFPTYSAFKRFRRSIDLMYEDMAQEALKAGAKDGGKEMFALDQWHDDQLLRHLHVSAVQLTQTETA